MKKKKYTVIIIIISIVLLIGVALLFGKLSSKGKEKEVFKYSFDVLIEFADDKKAKRTTMSFKNDGKSTVGRVGYLDNLLYVVDEDLYLADNGKYHKLKRKNSYKDIYRILGKLDFPKEDGNYNPKIEKETANALLESLLIDSSVEKDVYANLTFKDGRIVKFSLYLSNANNFAKLDISIVFGTLEEDFENNLPVFYDEITDEMKEENVLFTKTRSI